MTVYWFGIVQPRINIYDIFYIASTFAEDAELNPQKITRYSYLSMPHTPINAADN